MHDSTLVVGKFVILQHFMKKSTTKFMSTPTQINKLVMTVQKQNLVLEHDGNQRA